MNNIFHWFSCSFKNNTKLYIFSLLRLSLENKKLFIFFFLICNILNFQFSSLTHAQINQRENEDLSCHECKINGEKVNALSYESSNICSENKNYLIRDFDELKKQDSQKDFFTSRTTETLNQAQFPKKCIQYAMTYFTHNILKAQDKAVPQFGTCRTVNGIPENANPSPCITEDYVHLVYNSFIDVAACMDLPQRNILAKLFNESGFHINMFAPLKIADDELRILHSNVKLPLPQLRSNQTIIGGDAGIGQLTGPALEDIRKNINFWKQKIETSSNPACLRIKNFFGNLPDQSKVKPEIENRCHLIHTKENPIQSLIFYGVLYKTIEKSVSVFWDQRQIKKLLLQSGFDIDSHSKKSSSEASQSPSLEKQIKEMLILLAYNAGAKEAVLLFENWIKYRIQILKESGPIQPQDLDFSKVALMTPIQLTKPNKNGIVTNKKFISELTVSQVNALQREHLFLKNKKSNLSPSDQDRLNYLNTLPFDKMGFPMYLHLYRKGWAKGYLTNIKTFSVLMSKKLGQNVCTDDAFLKFNN